MPQHRFKPALFRVTEGAVSGLDGTLDHAALDVDHPLDVFCGTGDQSDGTVRTRRDIDALRLGHLIVDHQRGIDDRLVQSVSKFYLITAFTRPGQFRLDGCLAALDPFRAEHATGPDGHTRLYLQFSRAHADDNRRLATPGKASLLRSERARRQRPAQRIIPVRGRVDRGVAAPT